MSDHEHEFSLTTQRWEYAQRTITLRMCHTCGLTHQLVGNRETGLWYWKRVEEWQEAQKDTSLSPDENGGEA